MSSRIWVFSTVLFALLVTLATLVFSAGSEVSAQTQKKVFFGLGASLGIRQVAVVVQHVIGTILL
jgi:hypothetical protein